MDYLIIAGGAWAGSLISGAIGWLKSGLPFNARTYTVSILSGVGSAIVFALAYQFSDKGLQVFDILAAIAAGAGVDNVVNRISGAIRVK